jgi:hypothetical protein
VSYYQQTNTPNPMTNVENITLRAVVVPSIITILNLLLLLPALPPSVGGAEGGPSSKSPLVIEDGVGVDAPMGCPLVDEDGDGVFSSPGYWHLQGLYRAAPTPTPSHSSMEETGPLNCEPGNKLMHWYSPPGRIQDAGGPQK